MDTKLHYRINNGYVEKVQEQILGRVNLDTFKKNLLINSPFCTGLLPKNTLCKRAVKKDGSDKGVILVEITPRIATILYKNGSRNSSAEVEQLKISTPFILLFFKINGDALSHIYPACSKKKIESLDDPIFILPFLNIYEDGNGYMCVGNMKVSANRPLHTRIDSLTNQFFSTEFNHDLHVDFPNAMKINPKDKDEGPSIKGWAKRTEAQPLFGIRPEVEYFPHIAGTVNGMFKRLGCEL